MPHLITNILLLISLSQAHSINQNREPTAIDDNFTILLPFETTKTEEIDLITLTGSDTIVQIVINRKDIGSSASDSLMILAYGDGAIAGMNVKEPHELHSDNYKSVNDILLRIMVIRSSNGFFTMVYYSNSSFVYTIRFTFADRKVDPEYVEEILKTLERR